MEISRRAFVAGLVGVLAAPTAEAAARFQSEAAPADPRLDKAFRAEKAGWITLHLEGAPRDRGYQYGALLAPEIDDAHRALRFQLLYDTHKEWRFYREAAERLFWKKLDREYQDELSGLAEGLKARGYPYDTLDMLVHNSWIDLADYYLPSLQTQRAGRPISRAPRACSAFVATGSATADGKMVMGHNFWWDYLLGQRWNVILDIHPTHGSRILMDALPGFIHSGTDFVVNSAGILICETTISEFMGFDENGVPEFMRARKAAQYAENLNDFVSLMSEGNNGGYANTWLVGDIKTGEIGKLQLGLKNVVFSHSKDGAYYGANYPEDPRLIAEECLPGADRIPGCLARKARWRKLLAENKGKVTAEKAKAFLADTYDETRKRSGASDSTLCGRSDLLLGDPSPSGAVNAKVVTTEMAEAMRFEARLGFPDGSAFQAKPFLEKAPHFRWMEPFLRDIPAHPWTTLEAQS